MKLLPIDSARRRHARRLGGVVVTLLALSPTVAIAAPPAQASTLSAASIASYEGRLLAAINVQRVKYHRVKLVTATCPHGYSVRWAAHLARTGTFYHQSMYTILAGCHAHVAAENLARGNASAERFVTAWMLSPGHRANILDGRLTKIGVSAAYAGGQWYIATDFTRP